MVGSRLLKWFLEGGGRGGTRKRTKVERGAAAGISVPYTN